MFKFFYHTLKKALSKTRSALSSRIQALLGKPWNEETYEQLEQILFEADLGTKCTSSLIEYLKSHLRTRAPHEIPEILKLLHKHTLLLLSKCPTPSLWQKPPHTPYVFLIVGVNGSGKTTSIAKLAYHFKQQGNSVLLAAGDTFRAAAIEQLDTWSKRLGIDLIKSSPGADPSSVAFDALTAAKARGVDIVFIDTAGRLQSKTDLMKELEKIRRTLGKVLPSAPHETLLVLDATTGQNALDQAKAFHAATPLSGIVLSKLDGSAKGGILLSITQEIQVPVVWIGTGEKQEDLEPFDPVEYANSLFSNE